MYGSGLVPLILDAAEHLRPHDLTILATVSHGWLYYVRKRLYRHPQIYLFRNARVLADTLDGNSSLASLVKGIALQPNSHSAAAKLSVEEEQNIVEQLLALEGLSRITLGGQLSLRAKRYLKLIQRPELVQELHLTGKYFFSPTPAEWDEALALRFTTLRKLRLTNIDLRIPRLAIGRASSISHLILQNSPLKDGGIVRLLNGATVICLDITSETPMDETIRLALIWSAVERIRYKVQGSSYEDLFADLKPHRAESLRSLHLDGQFMTADFLDTIGAMFRGLEELVVIGRETYVGVEEWKRFVRSGTPSSLRRLGLPWGTNRPRYVAWSNDEREEIREACGAMDIVLVNSSLAL